MAEARTGNTSLYLRGMKCVGLILENMMALAENEERRRRGSEALTILQDTPGMRNVLMGLPVDGPAIQVETVLGVHCQLPMLGAGDSMRDRLHATPERKKQKKSESRNGHRDNMRSERLKTCRVIFADPVLKEFCRHRFNNIANLGMIGHDAFLLSIVGEDTTLMPRGDEERGMMEEIFHRLQKAEDSIKDGKGDTRKRAEIGRSWLPDYAARDALLVQMETRWHRHISQYISKSGYLDVLAGVSIPGYEPVTKTERGSHPGAPKSTQVHFDDTPAVGGGFWEWSDHCLSPQFLEYFRDEGRNQMNLMLDPTAPGRCRYIRCESPLASTKHPLYFQMGRPPSASLIQAVQTTKFGDAFLKICNFVEAQRYAFCHGYLRDRYGSDVAYRFTPVRKDYDMLFVVLGHKSFALHTDSNELEYNNQLPGWEEKFIRVLTMFFQNTIKPIATMKFCPQWRKGSNATAAKASGTVSVGPLGASGVHEQGNFLQDRVLHCCEYSSERPISFRRCAFTARATSGCHAEGLTQLHSKQRGDIPIYGGPEEYCIPMHKLFEPCLHREGFEEASLQSDSEGDNDEASRKESHDVPRSSDTDEHFEDESRESEEEFLPESDTSNEPAETEVSLLPAGVSRKDLWYGRLLKGDRGLHVETGPPLSEWGETISQMLTSKEGCYQLLCNRVLLELDDGNGSGIPFGPCPAFETKGAFAKVGDRLGLREVCNHFGMPFMSSQANPPWSERLTSLNSIYLSKRYKASIECTQEVHGLLTCKQYERQGFHMYLAGGNAIEVDYMAKQQGSGTTWHHVRYRSNRRTRIQSNQANVVMDDAAQQGRVVTVFFHGQYLPKAVQGSGTMCLHGGFYKIGPRESCPPLYPPSRLLRMMSEFNDHKNGEFPPVEAKDFSFLRSQHLRCWLSPVQGPVEYDNANEWTTLQLAYNDKRRMAFIVPEDFSRSDFMSTSSIVPTQPEIVKACLHELLPGVVNGDPKSNITMISTQKQPPMSTLTLEYYLDTLRRLLLGYCMRVVRLNIVQGNKKGSLQDVPCDILGDGTTPLCEPLGRNIQMKSYPCPFFSGEANFVFLQECNGGAVCTYAEARESRHGGDFLSSNQDTTEALFIQCVIAATCNPAFNGAWSTSYLTRKKIDGVGHILPQDKQTVSDFLKFIQAGVSRGSISMRDVLLNGMDPKLREIGVFSAVLEEVCAHARSVVNYIIDVTMKPSTTRADMVSQVRAMLSSCSSSLSWDPFHVSAILQGMDELVDGVAFGVHDPKEVGSYIQGCGQVQVDGYDNTSTILHAITARVKDDLCSHGGHMWYGLLSIKGGRLHNNINGRPVSLADIAHCHSIVGAYQQWEHTRHSPTEDPYERNMFPVRGVTFPRLEKVALHAISLYKAQPPMDP